VIKGFHIRQKFYCNFKSLHHNSVFTEKFKHKPISLHQYILIAWDYQCTPLFISHVHSNSIISHPHLIISHITNTLLNVNFRYMKNYGICMIHTSMCSPCNVEHSTSLNYFNLTSRHWATYNRVHFLQLFLMHNLWTMVYYHHIFMATDVRTPFLILCIDANFQVLSISEHVWYNGINSVPVYLRYMLDHSIHMIPTWVYSQYDVEHHASVSWIIIMFLHWDTWILVNFFQLQWVSQLGHSQIHGMIKLTLNTIVYIVYRYRILIFTNIWPYLNIK